MVWEKVSDWAFLNVKYWLQFQFLFLKLKFLGDSRTKCSGEDSEVHSADPTAQNSALEGKVIVKPQATYFEKLESSSTSGLLESYDKNEHTDYLKVNIDQ